MAKERTVGEKMAQEELVRAKEDERGQKWIKKYVGGGAHFLNWLQQYREVYGEENVEIEEVDSKGFGCFEKGNEKMYRIWVRESK